MKITKTQKAAVVSMPTALPKPTPQAMQMTGHWFKDEQGKLYCKWFNEPVSMT